LHILSGFDDDDDEDVAWSTPTQQGAALTIHRSAPTWEYQTQEKCFGGYTHTHTHTHSLTPPRRPHSHKNKCIHLYRLQSWRLRQVTEAAGDGGSSAERPRPIGQDGHTHTHKTLAHREPDHIQKPKRSPTPPNTPEAEQSRCSFFRPPDQLMRLKKNKKNTKIDSKYFLPSSSFFFFTQIFFSFFKLPGFLVSRVAV